MKFLQRFNVVFYTGSRSARERASIARAYFEDTEKCPIVLAKSCNVIGEPNLRATHQRVLVCGCKGSTQVIVVYTVFDDRPFLG